MERGIKEVRITNGIEVRFVTPSVAADKSTLAISGWWVEELEAPKPNTVAKEVSKEKELPEETDPFGEDLDTEVPTKKSTKAK